jgi:hypothetical protein
MIDPQAASALAFDSVTFKLSIVSLCVRSGDREDDVYTDLVEELTDVVCSSESLVRKRACMDEREQQRKVRHRLAVLRHADEISGNVSATCHYYGISWRVLLQRPR